MESRQYDQVAWQSCEDASLGLLELVCRPSESMITSLIASDRPDDPLAEPPSWEAAVRYYHVRTGRLPDCKDRLINLLSRDVAELDRCLGEQVDAVLHHPRFQSLEAAWRGLELLIEGTGGQENLKVKVLHLPKAQLDADLHGAIEFDQSAFFRKVYEEEYGMAGGEPYGILLGNYEFRNSPSDIELLSKIKEVAAAAFAPFVAGVDPMLFGLPHFGLLPRISNLGELFNSLKFLKWNALREQEDSRYLGLVLPRIAMRLPYTRDPQRVDGFVYEEDVSAADGMSYLWGNAAFAFGNVVIRAFALSGWFADIRGIAGGADSGGVVDLPSQSFGTDRPGVAVKCSIDSILSEARDKELSDLGFITLCDCEDTAYSAFFANQSIQKTKVYHEEEGTTNARISSMLQYVFCASRFAHYLKVIGRDKVGQVPDRRQLQSLLHDWIHQYVAADPGASAATRAKYPLREALIEIDEHPADPGHFRLKLFLAPHVQLDQLSAGIRLVTALPKAQ
ncbi:MAG: type VI secretion system contractile sheath large subunit [Planctomycetota bacterium]